MGVLSRIPLRVYLGVLALPGLLLVLPNVGILVAAGGYFSTPSGSMRPALPLGSAFLATAMSGTEVPKRGTIAVYGHPRQAGVDFIKRVIALPGERFQMVDGVPVIDGMAALREEMPDHLLELSEWHSGRGCLKESDAKNGLCLVRQWRETLPDGTSHAVLDLGESALDNTAETVVPEGHVLVMGDNRDDSLDSRFTDHGMVPIANIKYRAWRFHPNWPPMPGDWDRLWQRIE